MWMCDIMIAFRMVKKMPDISFLRENVRGIKGVFLTKDEKVLDLDLEDQEDVKYLSNSISYLFETIYDKERDIRRIEIVAANMFFVFYRSPYILGVVTSSDINVPMLKVVAEHMLENVEVPAADREKVIELPTNIPVFDSGYRVSREDILEGFRSVPDEKWKAVVLERIDGKKSVDNIIEEALPVLHREGLKNVGERDYTKEDLRGLIQDFLSTTVLKLKT